MKGPPHFTKGFPSPKFNRVLAEFAENSYFLLLMRWYFDEIPLSFNGHPRGILGIAERSVLQIVYTSFYFSTDISDTRCHHAEGWINKMFTSFGSNNGLAERIPSTCIRTLWSRNWTGSFSDLQNVYNRAICTLVPILLFSYCPSTSPYLSTDI